MGADKCCLYQVGPKGEIRAVMLDLKGSWFTDQNNFFLNYVGRVLVPAHNPSAALAVLREDTSQGVAVVLAQKSTLRLVRGMAPDAWEHKSARPLTCTDDYFCAVATSICLRPAPP
jgi:hypothetical protein